jgi:hypothetical protein
VQAIRHPVSACAERFNADALISEMVMWDIDYAFWMLFNADLRIMSSCSCHAAVSRMQRSRLYDGSCQKREKIEKEEVGFARCGFVLQLPGVCAKAGLSQLS